ncbi:MAG TPA: hypothetical protein VM163_01555 [bacterium]|nr:hypothetical protein [bacterium]
MEAFLTTTFGRISTRLAAAAIAVLVGFAVNMGIDIDPNSAEAIRAGLEALIMFVSLGSYALIHRFIKGKVGGKDV